VQPRQGSNPYWLTDVNGTLFFGANDRVHGFELWKSDGAASGTTMVKDIHPEPGGSDPVDLTAVDGTLFFAAHDGVHGYELWKSDGTASGTVMVKDVNEGPDAGIPCCVGFTVVNGTLFFAADDGVHGVELWKSDGTEAGTVMVKDIRRGAADSRPVPLGDYNGVLFIAAIDRAHGCELWKSDGTATGTVLVKDINPGWPASVFLCPDGITPAAIVGTTLLFTADDGVHGTELWRSDGTSGGTIQVKDIQPGSAESDPNWLTGLGGRLYFSADDGIHGQELWKSDGTAAGTVLVKDIHPGPGGSAPRYFTELNGGPPLLRPRRHPWIRAVGERWDGRGDRAGGRHPAGSGRLVSPLPGARPHRRGRDIVLRC
jgi:ELWxxDGT repeat protein